MHGIVLAAFASLIAPFGGFFASGMKRAHGIKVWEELSSSLSPCLPPSHALFISLSLSLSFLRTSLWLVISLSHPEVATDGYVQDFDSIFPGHGGFYDRFDCQLIMGLCTYVHYVTFIRTSAMSLSVVYNMVDQLSPSDKRLLLKHLQSSVL